MAQNPWDNDAIVAPSQRGFRQVLAVPPKAPSGYQTVPGGVAAIPGGPDDLSTIGARERLTTGIQTAAQIAAARERAAIELENERRKSNLPVSKNQAFDNLSGLRKEFDSQADVKNYRTVLPMVISAMNAPDTGAGDLSTIYAFGKVMDPGSVVREGEMDMASQTASLPDQLQQWVGRIRSGQRLAPDVRRNLIESMRRRAGDLNTAFLQQRARYGELAQRAGFDPVDVIGAHPGEAYQQTEADFLGRPVRNANGMPGAAPTQAPAASPPPPSDVPGGGGGPASPPGGQPPAPPSPQEFYATLRQMLNDQRPQSEIMAYIQRSGSGLNEQDTRSLGDYELARLRGQPTQVGVMEPPETSTVGGFIAGALKPVDRAAAGLEYLYNAIPGLPDTHMASEANATRRPALERTFGKLDPTAETIGNVVGTLPLAYTGGPITQGALTGALLGNSNNVSGVATDAILGGVLGKAGDTALRGIAGLISPNLSASAANFVRGGGRATPGQMFGGRLRQIEDAATSLPVAGPKINAAREQALADYNLGGVNRVLAPIGESLPQDIQAGHAAVDYAGNRLSTGYNDTLARIGQIQGDPTFGTRMRAIMARAERDGLPQAQRDQLQNVISDYVENSIPGAGAASRPGAMFRGRDFKRLDERLGDIATSYGGNDDPFVRQLGGYVGDVKDQVGALVRRQAPSEAQALRNLDEGWANYARIRNAASRSVDDGIFTPGELASAVRAGDRSVGKGATARGDALMQDYAKMGSDVLPSRIGNSGTGDRENLTSAKAWAAGLLLSPAYNDTVQNTIRGIFGSRRPASAKAVAEIIKSLPAGTLAPALAAPRY